MDMPSRNISDDRDDSAADEGSRGFFGKFGSRMSRQRSEAPAANLHTRDALLLLQNYEESGRGWFWATDANGRITYITDTVAKLMGRSANELVGTAFTDLFLPVDSHGERQRTLPFLMTKQSKFDELP
ncbi:MAG: PAS domain-containing protein, partial [Sphingopyxis sp.]|nr:PAS domain-containing protein [Sphingopyxis sp.]